MTVDRVAQNWSAGRSSGADVEPGDRPAIGDTLTVALLRCDGGEEMDRFTSDDSRLLEFIEQSAKQRGLTAMPAA